jgi:hypothetical protein
MKKHRKTTIFFIIIKGKTQILIIKEIKITQEF